MEEKVFICECRSFEHQAIFTRIEETRELYVYIHLITYDNFFKRLWIGLKYAFGYRCRFGEWDEFIMRKEDEKRLIEELTIKE